MKKVIVFAVLVYLCLFHTEQGTKFMNNVLNKAKQPLDEVSQAKDKMEERNNEVTSDLEETDERLPSSD